MKESAKGPTAKPPATGLSAEGVIECIAWARGVVDRTRGLALKYGTRKFGRPDDAIMDEFERIGYVGNLEVLLDRIFDGTAHDWKDAIAGLATLEPKKIGRRRSERDPAPSNRRGAAG